MRIIKTRYRGRTWYLVNGVVLFPTAGIAAAELLGETA